MTIAGGFDIKDTGFRYPNEVIHLFIGGSELHGAKLQGTDDHDIYGVYIEPPEKMLGLSTDEHFVWSTSGTERRNGPGDVDVTLYGLKKWAGLACKGNPSVLHFLFAPNLILSKREREAWQFILDRKRAFLARSHYKQFIGYAVAQMARMVGERSRKVNRPELVEQHGFDTKFAMHVIRILMECEELLNTGWISLPNPQKDLLISIRKGEVTQDWVIRDAERRIQEIKGFAETSTALPETVDRDDVSRILTDLYRWYWQQKYKF